jgi:hypothetical protein
MVKTALRVAGVALVLTIGLAVAAWPRSSTLADLFPDLADLPETRAVFIGIGWYGLSALSPLSAGYPLELHDDQFTGEGRFQVADGPTAKRAIAVPRAVVRAFLTAASKVPLVEGEYKPRIEHTDDYPSLEIDVETKQGPLHIGSQSQQKQPQSGTYVDRSPWRIGYRNRTFVVTASDLDQAFESFEPYLQDDAVFEELVKQVEQSRAGESR